MRCPVTAEIRGSNPLSVARIIDRNAQRCAAGLLIRVRQVRSLFGQPVSPIFPWVMWKAVYSRYV